MRTKQVSVWFGDVALHAAVKARAEAEGRSVATVVEEALRGWLVAPMVVGEFAEMGRPASPEAPPVKKAAKGTPVAATKAETGPTVGRDCRSCGHELRKHEPHCILMGCACRKFR